MKPSKTYINIPGHWPRTIVLAAFFCLASGLLSAQEKNAPSVANQVAVDEEDVIVTDIGLDNMRIDPLSEMEMDAAPAAGKIKRSVRPETLRIKEDQIITMNRSLKKIIEENEKLRKQSGELDAQLKQLLGQRNIDQTRVNTISVERDAYKSQNEIMSGLTQRYVEDIENLKRELAEKENQLAHQPPGVVAGDEGVDVETVAAEVSGSAQAVEDPTAVPVEPIGLGTIQVRKEDQDLGKDILKMLDDVKQKSQRLMADEAKVHYNMGNMFFKRKDYQKARNEFEAALRLSPQDASTHFNLAYVNSEYFHDYPAAMEHYREYLDLNPAADDAPLVREKIIEAELFLRARIPSNLEKQVEDERDRVNK